MKIKRFVESRHKLAKVDKNEINDKENRVSIDQYRFKKFSVDLHKYSEQNAQVLGHRRSIFDQQISVFLDQSNNKSHLCDKEAIEVDIKQLSHAINKRKGIPLIQLLEDQLPEIKSNNVKTFIERLISKLMKENQRAESSIEQVTIEMSDSIIRPYIEQQIILLQKNHQKLLIKKKKLSEIKDLETEQKQKILNELKLTYQSQKRQLQSI